MRRLRSIGIFVLGGVVWISSVAVWAGQVTVTWDPVTSTSVSGYKLYYGSSSRNYTSLINVGNTTTYTITGLMDKSVIYVAATSYNAQGQESAYSAELVANVPAMDTDKDSVSDWDEENIYHTDPRNPDTDGDGVKDGEEIARGTDPLTPSSPSTFAFISNVASFSNTSTSIYLNQSFAKPVVIMGPPTYKEADPGVVRVGNVSASSFSVRFQEWSYLNGRHATEKTSFLVVNEGYYRPSDGSIWEAKTLPLSGTKIWTRVTFTTPFPGTPKVFTTVQTTSDSKPVLTRVKNVDANGFDVALFHEEKLNATSHGTEIVGYVAVWSPTEGGVVNGTPYALGGAMVSSRWSPAGTFSLLLQEETSADKETSHGQELVHILVLGTNIFAQNVWWTDQDTASLRLK